MDKLTTVVSFTYSIFLIIGGIIGYIKVQSIWSLFTGLISSISIFLACKIGSTKPKIAYLIIVLISLILGVFFGFKFFGSHAFMPHGLMVILSVITFVSSTRGWIKKTL